MEFTARPHTTLVVSRTGNRKFIWSGLNTVHSMCFCYFAIHSKPCCNTEVVLFCYYFMHAILLPLIVGGVLFCYFVASYGLRSSAILLFMLFAIIFVVMVIEVVLFCYSCYFATS